VHEVNGHEVDGPESAVDPSNKLVYRRTQVLVLLYILSGRDGKLNENNLPIIFV